MGVPGLWDVLRPTSEVRSLTDLAVESGFVKNEHGHRAYRVGIDTSIWFFHALGGREGENPELRTLFFRCVKLLTMPFLPIFVFDGPRRPKIKRGKAIGGKEHWMVNNLRNVLDAFGFECRTAPGEAEAELAYLNRIGVIDAVLSDDVDCFIFGACTVIRNSSATLMGNRAHGAKNADGKDDGQHVNIYHSEDIKSHAKVNLSQGGLILIALLRGGDYDQKGIDGCGVNTAHALARAGFGDTLLKAARSSSSGTLSGFLPTWRKALQHELRTNASGFAQRKSPTLAQRITDDFPRLDVLRCYTHPITSEAEATGARGLDVLWQKRADVAKIAHVCEMYFEWGVEKTIIKRFRNFLWQGAMLRLLLQAALDRDGHGASTPSKSRSKGVETPSKALARSFGGMALGADSDEDDEPGYITAIHGERRHTSTGGTLEYRLEIDPRKFVARARSGIQGIRVELGDSAAAGDYGEDDDDDDEDEDGKKKKQGTKTQPADPDSKLRMWMPAVMVECAFPALVADFKDRKAVKEAKKGKRTQVKKPGWKVRQEEEEEEEERSTPVKPAKKSVKPAKSAKAKAPPSNSDEDSDGVPIAKPNSKFKGKAPMGSTLSKWPASKSKSIVQLLDEDPFSQPVESKHSSPSKPSWLPRPFPMARDNVFAESSQSATSSRTRKYLSTSASPPESKPIHAPLKKSPRKSTEHTWPRKPTRSPSPSPRRTFAAKMRPLAMATARTSAFKMDGDVIIISSDSDDPPPQSKKLNALTRKKILGSRKVSDIVDLS